MEWNLPGTALAVSMEEMSKAEDRLRAMFLAGGIALSQVSAITGLEPYTVQNWVKRGFLTGPQQKRYSFSRSGLTPDNRADLRTDDVYQRTSG